MKRCTRVFCALFAILFVCSSAVSALQTDLDLPLSAEQSELRWSYRAGTDYKNAPTIPAPFDGKVYFMHNYTLSCIDAKNGALLQECTLSGRNQYTQVSVLCTESTVYCPMDSGKIQAVSRASMTPGWVYTDPLGGQALTQIVTDGERLYTGFWNDEEEDANFVCLDAKTGDCLWRVSRKGGYYRGACVLSGDLLILGGDDGSAREGVGRVLCIDKRSGEVYDTLDGISGDLRAGISADGNAFFFATKAGILYKVTLSGRRLTLACQRTLHGACTTTPIVCGDKLYLTAMSGRFEGELLVLDTDSLSIQKTVPLRAYPQGDALLCTADPIRIYTTYNGIPGGLLVVDPESGTSADLFEPAEGMQNYCTSSVQITDEGVLLYKNDSGVIFAVGKKPEKPLTRWQKFVQRLRAFFERIASWFRVKRS